MSNKHSNRDSSLWQQFVAANPDRSTRYARFAAVPADLFEAIGEDLASKNREIRKFAFEALYAAMPDLELNLHERGSRDPRWREGSGKGQLLTNRGMDVLTKLILELVDKGTFKADSKRGSDPRPYIRTVLKNWERDSDEKSSREVFPVGGVTELADNFLHSESAEDPVIESFNLSQLQEEIRRMRFLKPQEYKVFDALFYDDADLQNAAKTILGLTDQAARKWVSRTRRKFVADRDRMTSAFLEGLYEDVQWGLENVEKRGWKERLPVVLKNGLAIGPQRSKINEKVLLQPLTAFKNKPGNLFLLSLPAEIRDSDYSLEALQEYLPGSIFNHPVFILSASADSTVNVLDTRIAISQQEGNSTWIVMSYPPDVDILEGIPFRRPTSLDLSRRQYLVSNSQYFEYSVPS